MTSKMVMVLKTKLIVMGCAREAVFRYLYKNVHSFFDRSINRFPIKNVERFLAKNFIISLTRIVAD